MRFYYIRYSGPAGILYLWLAMMDEFEIYLRAHTHLNDGDLDRIRSLATTKGLRRNEFLLREGEICRHKIFVIKGLLRTFGTAADGSEHILQFSPEHSWTLDVESYDRQIPARSNIAAVENSQVLLWPKADFESLLADIPQLKSLAQQLIARNIYNSRQRLLTALSATPEEKYHEFTQSFPDFLARLPLHMIAAYLGISLKTLTRIRQAQLRR
ncbi:MAG TPA: Crp/Fnr family transcriptional regulator [Puia sp.]|nr:Crp/Fnr family transcriptional regulator [Puia sp.]